MAEPNIKDLAYRTAAGLFGGPVDLATMVMRPFGYKTPDEQVFGSSEYIGKKLEDVGLVSSARAPITEFLTSMAVPTPGGIAKGAALAAPMIGGIFVGKGAKTWDALQASKAKMLADMGTDARTIWQQTGTWKGPDGKWRQEIDDSAAQFVSQFPKPDGNEMNRVFAAQDLVRSTDAMKREARAAGGFTIPGFYADKPGLYDEYVKAKNLLGAYESKYVAPQQKSGILEKFITHDDLYDAYPSLSRTPTIHNRNHSGGAFSENANQILIGGGNEKSIGLHEVQHAIQQREGFARGGNPQSTIPDIAQAKYDLKDIERKMERLQDAASEEALFYISRAKQEPEYKKFVEDAFEKYKKQFGERSESNPYGVDLQTAVKFDLLEKNNSLNYFGSEADKLRKMANLDPNQAYRNLAGEAEARATQARMNMTPEQRRAMFPEESYDVPINELIIRGVSD